MKFEGECYIRKAGLGEDGKVGILLKAANPPNVFDYTWYIAKPQFQREYLAIAMAAITANKRVFAKMQHAEIEHDELAYFGIVKE